MFAKSEELNLTHCLPTANRLDQLNYPNLADLSLIGNMSDRASLTPSIEQFLLRHKLTIKKLNLENVDNFNLAIFEQMPVLEELKCRLGDAKYVQTNYSDSEVNQPNFKRHRKFLQS